AAGVDLDGLAGGVIAEDFTNDGLLDLLASDWDVQGQLHFYRNNGDGTFEDQTEKAGLTGLTGGLNMVQADYDNDGLVDALILRGAWLNVGGKYPNSLLKNRGNGVFEDVTEAAGLLSFHPTQTAVWFDYNSDGNLDLFIGNEGEKNNPHPCELFRNNGNGTFTECARESGMDFSLFVKGVTSDDFDLDGRPDLYLSIRGSENKLYRNAGPKTPGASPDSPWHFEDVTAKAGVGEPILSFPTWFCDYNNDGWPDILVAGYSLSRGPDVVADYLGLKHSGERTRLYRNNRDGTFKDVSKEAGLYRMIYAMGSNFGDIDNDGFVDFYFGTGDPDFATLIPNRMFKNQGGTNFQEVTTSGGFGHLQKGHAVAFADLDNDGDQDIYESIGGAYTGDNYRNVLFENPGTTNRLLHLKLEGVRTARSAIGARIKLDFTENGAARSVYRTVNSGGSFGANSFRQEIGIGRANKATLEITWPVSGTKQKFTDIQPGQLYTIREGETDLKSEPLKKFEFSRKASPHIHQHH
ncbi:MAG: VCBS repeat-containing protein, partial [Verrucomicrobiota bacterium]|nr:VCBS repeat-containing protein [Verrucomicrobiota bacterium]